MTIYKTIAQQIKKTAADTFREAYRRAAHREYVGDKKTLRITFSDGSYITFKQ